VRLRLKDPTGVHEIDVRRQDNRLTIQIGERSLELEVFELPPAEFVLKSAGRVFRGYAARHKDRIFLQIGGRSWSFDDITREEETRVGAAVVSDNQVVAPMPGSVIKLLVEEGQEVKRDQPLVIVEAMKMENEVRAPADAVVSKLLVEPGQQVGAGERLIELMPLEGSGEGRDTSS